MKIYNKIVIKILTGEVISEDSFEYDGPVAECKGGGSSTTTTIDKEYNAGMLALSQEQQDWARQMYNIFKTGINPGDTSEMQYMQNIVNANQGLLPEQTATERARMGLEQAQIGSAQGLLPEQTALERARMGLEQAQIGSAGKLLPEQTALESAKISDTMTGLQERAPVRSKLYNEAVNGIDIGQRMNLAQSDVAQSFSGAEGIARRTAARMGRNPADVDLSRLGTERAKAIAAARTNARINAENENFNRLRSAMTI